MTVFYEKDGKRTEAEVDKRFAIGFEDGKIYFWDKKQNEYEIPVSDVVCICEYP